MKDYSDPESREAVMAACVPADKATAQIEAMSVPELEAFHALVVRAVCVALVHEDDELIGVLADTGIAIGNELQARHVAPAVLSL